MWEPLQSAEGVTVHDGRGGLLNVPARLITFAPHLLALLRRRPITAQGPGEFTVAVGARQWCDEVAALLDRLDKGLGP